MTGVDRVRAMLDRVMAVPVPDGFTLVYRERRDPVLNYTFRDVTISPVGVDVATFTFGTRGGYAYIQVPEDEDGYRVGVFARDVGYFVQSCAHVETFRSAQDAVTCALGELRGELQHQQRFP